MCARAFIAICTHVEKFGKPFLAFKGDSAVISTCYDYITITDHLIFQTIKDVLNIQYIYGIFWNLSEPIFNGQTTKPTVLSVTLHPTLQSSHDQFDKSIINLVIHTCIVK